MLLHVKSLNVLNLFYNDYETSYTTYINHARWHRCLRSVVLKWEEEFRTIEKRTEHKLTLHNNSLSYSQTNIAWKGNNTILVYTKNNNQNKIYFST